ncbi:hypothetical protein AOA12_20305 [Microbacterium sp. No. 7]|nr:hypothetical protein AOA12_20305 [Microbacterium sp. No. 7]
MRTTMKLAAAVGTAAALTAALTGCTDEGSTTASADGDAVADCMPIALEVADTLTGSAWEQALKSYIERVQEGTDGRVMIRLLPGGQLGGEIEMVAQVKQGNLGLVQAGSTGLKEFSPIFVPYLFDDAKAMDFATSEIMQGWKDAIREREGIRVLAVEYFPPRWITSNTPIHKPADLNGLKIRVPEIPALVEAFEAFGATPVALPFPDTYYALQTGAVDGQENPPSVIESGKLQEVQDYVAITNHAQGFRYLLINEDRFQSICESDRAVMEAEVSQLVSDQEEQLRAESDALLDGWVSSGAVQITDLDIAEFAGAVGDAGSTEAEEAWGPGVLEQIRELYGPNS